MMQRELWREVNEVPILGVRRCVVSGRLADWQIGRLPKRGFQRTDAAPL